MPRRVVRFSCHGHHNIRGSHHKTLEITREVEISQRATCIVGVGADFDPVELARLRGPVRLRLRHGSKSEELTATVTPFTAVRQSLVLRRSDQRLGNTFAHRASKAASDLSRDFMAGLEEPNTVLEVEISEQLDEGVAGALSFLGLPSARLEALLPDAESRLSAIEVIAAPQPRALEHLQRHLPETIEFVTLDRSGVESLIDRLRSGCRMAAIVFQIELGGCDALWDLARRAAEAEIPMSPLQAVEPWLATLVVAGFDRRHCILEHELIRGPEQLRRRLRFSSYLGLTAVLGDVVLPARDVVESVLDTVGDRRICLGWGVGKPHERFLRGRARVLLAGDLPGGRGGESIVLAIDPGGQIDPEAPAPLLYSLLEEGVSVRSLSRSLAKQPGWSRRRAYEVLLKLASRLDSKDSKS